MNIQKLKSEYRARIEDLERRIMECRKAERQGGDAAEDARIERKVMDGKVMLLTQVIHDLDLIDELN
jgi:hypothetical protein